MHKYVGSNLVCGVPKVDNVKSCAFEKGPWSAVNSSTTVMIAEHIKVNLRCFMLMVFQLSPSPMRTYSKCTVKPPNLKENFRVHTVQYLINPWLATVHLSYL